MKRSLNVFLPFVCLLFFALPVFAQQKTWDELMKDGNLASDQKRFAEAENLYREALRVLETRNPKSDQPKLRISTLNQLTKALEGQKKTDDAELVGLSAVDLLDVTLKNLSSSNQEERHYAKLVTVKVYGEVADIFIAHKKMPEAENLLQRLIRHQEAWKKSNEEQVDRALKSTGSPQAQNQTILNAAISSSTDNPAGTYFKLGNLYFDDRKFPEAENCFQTSLKLSTVSPEAAKMVPLEVALGNPVLMTNLGIAQAAQQKWQPAEASLLRAIAVFQKRNLLNSTGGQNAIRNYVLVLKKQGRAAEAETFLDKLQAGETIEPPK